jgi:PERQ amino acid-rich with GYF domain-containing protein
MPDRMRWVYLDPQGQIQGPFTGLEMNDWYKANFFTPDLRVKKVEDPEFEPLGQLIRRIGNSREPFLVPQIGIAHGPPMQSGPFGPGTGSGIIPPLSGVFPTFGRTLTAEEQNNLERRKQEEQFLMAQQRDFMMRQQAMAKFQIQPSLQHHSSAHSLQSQPSFGSMTSPLGVSQQQHHQLQHQQPIGALGPAGVFDTHPGANPAAIRAALGNGELFRQEDLANLSMNERQMLASLQGEPAGTESGAPQPIGTPGDASLRYGLPEANELKEDDEGFKDRLQEFEDLRAEHDAEQAAAIVDESQESSVRLEETIISTMTAIAVEPLSEPAPSATKASKASKKKTTIEESSLSLTQQVQKTQASVAAAAAVPPPPQPTEPGMPMPFPPPASTTPLPAPTAQRARSNLPEQFSRSQTATPDVIAQPPPLAPWAKEPGQEGQKGPSLKEIQEAEARKAAKAEEAAAALRKAAMEQEAALLREKEKSAAVAAAAANAGLPATSTWGQSSPVSSVSPWAKPGAVKAKGATPIAASAVAGAKKTLADIQREEEARKLKAKEVAIQTGGGAPISIGKSYANLAGKPNHGPTPTAPSPILTGGSGWATVGAGGKVKSPSTVPSQLQSRSASTSSAKPILVAPVKLAPKSIISSTSIRAEPVNAAMEEFNKWAYRELSRGITGVSDSKSFSNNSTITCRNF